MSARDTVDGDTPASAEIVRTVGRLDGERDGVVLSAIVRDEAYLVWGCAVRSLPPIPDIAELEAASVCYTLRIRLHKMVSMYSYSSEILLKF